MCDEVGFFLTEDTLDEPDPVAGGSRRFFPPLGSASPAPQPWTVPSSDPPTPDLPPPHPQSLQEAPWTSRDAAIWWRFFAGPSTGGCSP